MHHDSDYTDPPWLRLGGLGLITCHDTDGHERVLLLDPYYKAGAQLPGGSAKHDEPPWAACQREVREETGLPVVVGRLLAVDYTPQNGDTVPGLNHVYDCGIVSPETTVRLSGDHTAYLWVRRGDLEDHTTAAQAARIRACLDARGTGAVAQLVRGSSAWEGSR